jgi:hypothetical protein
VPCSPGRDTHSKSFSKRFDGCTRVSQKSDHRLNWCQSAEKLLLRKQLQAGLNRAESNGFASSDFAADTESAFEKKTF